MTQQIHQYSSIKQANDFINTINQMKQVKSPSNRYQTQKQSQISQYYNLEHQAFSSPANSDPLFESTDKNQRQFPTLSTQRQTSHRLDQMLNTRQQNLKESHIEQSLQKAFSLNRNSQRIPFKKKQCNFSELNYPEGQKRSYNFYEPQYSDYYVKQDTNFWTQTFEKFYDKRGSSQTLDFPSFNQKEQSKVLETYSEINKLSQIEDKTKSQTYEKYANKSVIAYSFIAVIILLIGLNFLFPK